MRDYYAHLIAVADVKSVGKPNAQDDFVRVNLTVMSCTFSVNVPRSVVIDQKGVPTIKPGSVVFVKGRLSNDSNVKSFDGHNYASNSFVMDLVEEFRLATKEEIS